MLNLLLHTHQRERERTVTMHNIDWHAWKCSTVNSSLEKNKCNLTKFFSFLSALVKMKWISARSVCNLEVVRKSHLAVISVKLYIDDTNDQETMQKTCTPGGSCPPTVYSTSVKVHYTYPWTKLTTATVSRTKDKYILLIYSSSLAGPTIHCYICSIHIRALSQCNSWTCAEEGREKW